MRLASVAAGMTWVPGDAGSSTTRPLVTVRGGVPRALGYARWPTSAFFYEYSVTAVVIDRI